MEAGKEASRQLELDFKPRHVEQRVSTSTPSAQVLYMYQFKSVPSKVGADVPQDMIRERIESLLARYK